MELVNIGFGNLIAAGRQCSAHRMAAISATACSTVSLMTR